MEKITSVTNETIKETAKLHQKKFREETGLFISEGEKAIEGIIEAGYKVISVFKADEKEFAKLKGDKNFIVNEAVLNKISSTKSPCRIVAVAKQKKYELNNFSKMNKLILLENIKDAGNLGTILRACKAFGVEGVLLLGNTIDLYNPKVVRASVGCFDIPVINIDYKDIKLFKEHTIYSTALYENSKPLKDVNFKLPFIIAFGSEAEGLTKEFLKNKTENIKIETTPKVESLNLASAVSICLYEVFSK